MSEYIIKEMINEISTATLANNSSRDKLCKIKIQNFLWQKNITEAEKTIIYNIYFTYLLNESGSSELILIMKDKRLIRLLDYAGKTLLEENYDYYLSLDRGIKKPTTPRQRQFLRVCFGMIAPETEDEIAYSNHIKNRKNLILKIFNEEKSKEQLSARIKLLNIKKKKLSKYKKYKCPRCDGYGLLPGSRSPCSNCGGIGYVQQT